MNPVEKRQFYRRDPITTIALIVVVFLASQLVAGLLVALYPALRSWTADEGTAWLQTSVLAQFIYIAIAELTAIWLVLKLLRRAKITRKRIGLVRPVIKDVGRALAGYGVYFLAYIVIITIATNISNFIDVEQSQNIGFEAAASPEQLFLVFLSLVILPPIAEEIMFRGFLFTSLRAKYRFRYAAVITSILFGIAHLQFGSGAPLLWVAAIDTFVLSCVLCYLREKSGSLWPSIFLHALKNGIAFTILFHDRF